MAMLETPSRIWRRIEAVEGRSKEMPSLPSLPAFEDSEAASTTTSESDRFDEDISLPIHSTPAALSSHHSVSTIRAGTASAAKFASSIASRSATVKSALSLSRSRGAASSASRGQKYDSFDVSVIPLLPGVHEDDDGTGYMDEGSKESSVPEVYLPPEVDFDQDISLTDALEPVSRTNSPLPDHQPTPKKLYDYSVSLRSEPRPSPFDKFRNVAIRRPHSLSRPPTRTPSLSHTASASSSSAHSTPHSSRSIPLPRSASASPLPAASVPLPRSTTASPAVIARPDSGEESDIADNDLYSPLHQSHGHLTFPPEYVTHQFEANQSSEILPAPVTNDSPSEHSVSSQNSHELTFSSDAAPSSVKHADSNGSIRSPALLSTAFSSPAPSVAFTPTPAFSSRPRARFNVPPPPQFQAGENTQDVEEDENPLTPKTRRRSFLLSVINSTARPRPKFATPHPHARFAATPATTRTSAPTSESVPATEHRERLRTAFAGATPRMVHPLKQSLTTTGSESEGEGASGGSIVDGAVEAGENANVLARWSPSPVPSHTYESDRASFISTASSHDLTTHQRANASFDPVMNMGGHGIGRFNAGKLNAYLHGLNRRLQEENEALVERLRRMEQEKEQEKSNEGMQRRMSLDSRGRRLSAGGGALDDVEEDVSGEGWAEEKRELEELVDELKSDADRRTSERNELEQAVLEIEKALEEERDERARDKERWKGRMVEVEKGVQGIVGDLERRLHEAEGKVREVEDEGDARVKAVERQLAGVEAARDDALERVEKAEQVLESERELGGELREANDRLGKVMGDLRNANAQIRELEEEVMRSDGRIDELEQGFKDEQTVSKRLDEELGLREQELSTAEEKLTVLENRASKAEKELQETKAYLVELEEDAGAAVERIESLDDQLASAQERLQSLEEETEQGKEKVRTLDEEKEGAAELARQMEEALEAAEKKMLADEEEVATLKGRVASLERDLEREREKSIAYQQDEPSSRHISAEAAADIEALEQELDDANKEIARISTLLSQSPARKAIDKAKDTRIEILEREKEELAERVKILRNTMGEATGTPGRILNTSNISPIHRHVLSMHIRTPKTPGGPLKDLSWLNSTAGDPTVTPLLTEISRLQRELDLANESIDDKLDKLEDAGLGVVSLTKRLEDARTRIATLEDELSRLGRREDRRMARLERARCLRCHSKVDLKGLNRAAEGDESSLEILHASIPSNPPTPPTKTSEALRANLQSVNVQLDSMKQQWEEDKRRLLGEKAALQDTADKLHMQVRSAQEEVKKTEKAGEKARLGVQGELDKAKRTISGLENDLKEERARLRSLSTQQTRVHREKEDILIQMQRTESDLDDVKRQLTRVKHENHDLETELRVSTNAEQKARLLETKVTENLETIEQLRQERSLLVSDHKELQRQLSDASERAKRLRDEHLASQTSHDDRRHQLDLQLLEIEDLRKALSSQNSELRRTESEKNRIAAEKSDVARTVAALETDLKRVKKDAETFGRDLKLLRVEKEKLESKHEEEVHKADRARKQAQAQIRLLNEHLDGQREKMKKAQEQIAGHVCAMDEQHVAAMKLQHNKECKGLIVQIRYLKAKFTRESSLRVDLSYQKQYLLVLLAKYEKSDQTILASIARIGFPVPPPAAPQKRRRLKSAALLLVFIRRIKRISDAWREQSASKDAVAAALEEVRKRRALTAS